MKSSFRNFGLALAAMLLAVVTAYAAKSETFTGEVSDAMCGAKHATADKAACTRACVKKGSNYALVVGDKVYTLQSSDQSTKDKLDKLAGEKAKVTGTASGDTIEVSKVTAAK
ncbi:MAG TPA: hypothetical protein VGU90_04845 [Terriglobales bacterium]|jgi:hypothetical protein|nr:hypothetical protein [Terriglobales bacterium]